MENEIITYISQYAPIVLALIFEIIVVLVSKKTFSLIGTATTNTIKNLEEKAESKELKFQLKMVIQENKQLREDIAALKASIEHIWKKENHDKEV